MKRLFLTLFLFAGVSAFAQTATNAPVLTDPQIQQVISALPAKWQVYATIGAVLLMILGRAATSAMTSGGVIPILKSVFMGSTHATTGITLPVTPPATVTAPPALPAPVPTPTPPKPVAGAVTAALGLFLIGGSTSLIVGGCKNPTASTTAFNTFSAIGNGVDAAEKAYLDLVIQGKISTNSLAAVERDYNTFQRDFGVALAVASGSTNAIAPASLVAESSMFVTETSTAK